VTAGSLAGRGAVVTGGGSGIGEAIAHALAGAGAAVAVVGRTRPSLDRVAGELGRHGRRGWAIVCDVTDEAGVRAMADEARTRVGGVDILVNSAGGGGSAPWAKLTLADWNQMFAVHVTGTFLCTRELVPAMIERGWGRVINIASIAGLRGARYVAHYSAAKHAVIGFTRSLALELGGTGVTINALCPGYVATPMTDRTIANVQAKAGLSRDQALAAVLNTTGQERLVTPQEVADAALVMCGSVATTSGEAVVLGAEAPAR
jgi:3-hydroxybutyrate dehydrogenase